MASRELNILVAAKGALKAASDIGKVDSAVGRIGRTAATGLRTAGANLARIGVVAAGGAALMAKQGVSSLAALEDATTQVDGAIAQVGAGWTTTSADIATEANRIEASVQAAFDDKDITSATAGLIRYGAVAEDNLPRAMQVMTDLAAKTGDVDSASTLLGKALVDPTKAAGKLARQGIILTKEEQKQIATMTKAGKTAEAQALLLGILETRTKGAAAAAKGPYNDAMNVLTDVTEDAQRALGQAFLPVLEEVAGFLSTELAKPGAMNALRDIGKGMAGGLRQLISIAKGLPWQQIGDTFSLMGKGAKIALDLFTGLPPWVQTAVLTGWGLDKLSGGALGSIVGELGKGLIKGVLGMNAGVVNINAGVVNGGSGIPGGKSPIPTAGAPGLLSGALLPVTIAALAPMALVGLTEALLGGSEKIQERDLAARRQIAAGRGLDPSRVPTGPRSGMRDPFAEWVAKKSPVTPAPSRDLQALPANITAKQKREFDAIRDRAEANRIATVTAARTISASGNSDRAAIVSAINGIKLNTTTQVNVNVSGSRGSVTKQYSTSAPISTKRKILEQFA